MERAEATDDDKIIIDVKLDKMNSMVYELTFEWSQLVVPNLRCVAVIAKRHKLRSKCQSKYAPVSRRRQ